MPIYIDADTGEPVSDAELNNYEPADEPSWAQTLQYGLGSIPFKIARAGGGIGDAIEDTTGINIPFWDPQQTVDAANMFLQQGRQNTNMDKATGWKSTVGETIGDVAPMLGAMAGGAPLALGVGASQTFGNKYEQYRDADAGPWSAALGAGLYSGVETGINAIPVGIALKPGMGIAKRTGAVTLGNLLTSPVSTTNQLLSDAYFAGQVPEDIAGMYGENLRGDLVSSAIMGPTGHLVDSISQRPIRAERERMQREIDSAQALSRAEEILAADTFSEQNAKYSKNVMEQRAAELEFGNALSELNQLRDATDMPELRAKIDNGDNVDYIFRPDSAFEIPFTDAAKKAAAEAETQRQARLQSLQLDGGEQAFRDAENSLFAQKAVDKLQGDFRPGEDVTLPEAQPVSAKPNKGIVIPDVGRTPAEQLAAAELFTQASRANETMSRRYPLQSLESIFPEERRGIFQSDTADIQQTPRAIQELPSYRSSNVDQRAEDFFARTMNQNNDFGGYSAPMFPMTPIQPADFGTMQRNFTDVAGEQARQGADYAEAQFQQAKGDVSALRSQLADIGFQKPAPAAPTPETLRQNIAEVGYRLATQDMPRQAQDIEAMKADLSRATGDESLFREAPEQAKIEAARRAMEQSQLPPKLPEVQKPQTVEQPPVEAPAAQKERNPESGALAIGDIVYRIGNLFDSKKSDSDTQKITPEEQKRLDESPHHVRSPEDAHWMGDIFDKQIPLLSPARAAWHRAIEYPRTVAQRSKEFRPLFDRAMDYFKERDKTTFELANGVRDLFDLEDSTRVSDALIALRQLGKNATPEQINSLLKHLSPQERKIIDNVHATMAKSLDILEQKLIESFDEAAGPQDVRTNKEGRQYIDRTRVEQLRAAHETKVHNFISKLREERYVPFSRYGDSYVLGKDENGNVVHYSFHESKKSMKRAKLDLIRRGIKDVSSGYVTRPTEEAYQGLPPDLMARLREVDGEIETKYGQSLPPLGFTKHLESAKLTEGFSRDIQRSVADYIATLGSYTARLSAKKDLNAALKDIPANAQVYGVAKRYKEYILDSGSESAPLREALAHYYLGFNVKSALVNLTQTATLTYPMLAKYSKSPMKDTLHAMKLAANYFVSKERFAKTNPELATALQSAIADGEITSGASREMFRMAQGKSRKTTLRDASMAFFAGAEKTNRVIAFIAGHNAAKTKGLSGDAAMKFAEEFVNDTQFIYSKANRPEVFRGPLTAPLGTFRNFTGSYIRALRNELTHDRKVFTGTGWRMLAVMGSLGGGVAIPGVKEIVGLLTALGEDPKPKLREAVGDNKVADVLLYGLPNLAGFNLSGSIGIGELAPDLELGPKEALVRTVAGVAYDPIQRIERVAKHVNLDQPYRAFEAALPEAARNMAVAARWAADGAAKNPRNRTTFVPTNADIAKKFFGLTPPEYARAIERDNTIYGLEAQSRAVSENINFRIAQAIVNKGNVAGIYNEIRQHNATAPEHLKIKPDRGAINREIFAMKHGEIAQIKAAPKKARPEVARYQQLYK